MRYTNARSKRRMQPSTLCRNITPIVYVVIKLSIEVQYNGNGVELELYWLAMKCKASKF